MANKFWIVVCPLIGIAFNLSAADTTETAPSHKNTIFIELFGNAVSYSVNYDRIVFKFKNEKLSISTRMGFGHQLVQHDSLISYRLPMEINFLLGKKNEHFETGFGYTPFMYHSQFNEPIPAELKNYYIITARFGYRYIGSEGMFKKRIFPFFRISALAMLFKDYSQNNLWKMQPWLSLCGGVSF